MFNGSALSWGQKWLASPCHRAPMVLGGASSWGLGTWAQVLANYDYNTVEGKWVDCKPAAQRGGSDGPSWMDSALRAMKNGTLTIRFGVGYREVDGSSDPIPTVWYLVKIFMACERPEYRALTLHIHVKATFTFGILWVTAFSLPRFMALRQGMGGPKAGESRRSG